MKTASAVGQSPKSGRRAIVCGGTLAKRPWSPPTAGCCSAKYATAMVPVIVMPNWIESVTSTPHSPLTEAKKIVISEQTNRVRPVGQPSTMLPILAAARFTVAMMTRLKKKPRYTARNPRSSLAAFPEYLIS
jgi:hypothetical protein